MLTSAELRCGAVGVPGQPPSIMDGVFGIWVQQAEGAKFWMQVCSTELRNRGVRDVLITCCDGLAGLPEAIEAVWPLTTVQTCVVHFDQGSDSVIVLQRQAGNGRCPDGDLHRRHR